MKKFVVLTDSSCDLSKEMRQKYDIDYVFMYLIYDGKEMPASLDWDLYTPTELYDLMRNGTRIRTAQVPPAEYERAFNKYLSEGRDVLYLACSSALSGSVNTARIIAGELNEKYENKVYCVDALVACAGLGLLAIDVAKMRDGGKSVQECMEYAESEKYKYLQFGTPGDLTYLRRAGRVKASAAFFGNMFGVKPILISNRAGENLAIKKVKGRKTSLDEIIEMVKGSVVDPENSTYMIVHADCLKDAEYLKDRLEKEVHPKEVVINFLGPIIGASAGPEMVAVYMKGKEVQV